MSVNIFRIPIYRLSPAKFDKETACIVRYLVKDIDFDNSVEADKFIEKQYSLLSTYKPRYGEIVAWIEINLSSKFLSFDVWRKNRKRYRRQQYGDFVFNCGREIELDVRRLSESSSNEIYTEVCRRVELIKDTMFKNRYAALSEFYSIAKYYDWHGLVTDVISGKYKDLSDGY